MSYYTKIKKDFSFRKIKFKGIECYEGDGSSIRVTVTGTAQIIRQILKSEYTKYNAEGTWVKTRKFAGGDSIDVYLNRFPEDVYKAIKADLDVFDSYAVNHQNAKRVEIKTDDGMPINANTKYLHVYNEPPYGSKEKNEPQPDWDKILSSNKKTESSTSQPKTNFNRGELVRECSGWKVYKKTLPDGRIVYNAVKDKETAPNKGDWNAIKGEVYIETGFKWGRFGAFEKWGEITESRGEQGVLDALCDILNKYYKSEETTTQTTPQQTPQTTPKETTIFKEGDLFVYTDQKDYTYSINKIKDGYVYGGWSNDVNGRTGSYPPIPIQKMKNDFEYGNAVLLNNKQNDNSKLSIQSVVAQTKWSDGLKQMMIEDFKKSGYEFVNSLIGNNEKETSQNIQDKIIGFESGKHTYLQANMLANIMQYETTETKKEQIQKAIAGLQILADKGNEKAQKAIIGLQYLLNK